MVSIAAINGVPIEMMAREGERKAADGLPIRSNAEWKRLALESLIGRNEWRSESKVQHDRANALDAELTECREALAEWKAKADKLEERNNVQAKVQLQLQAIRLELSGLTLGQLEGLGHGYAGGLLNAYFDSK